MVRLVEWSPIGGTIEESTVELSIKTKRFELTYGLTDLYIRIGSWEAYWNALRPFTIW